MNNTFEFDILNWIQDHLATPFMDAAMKWISFLGNGAMIWIALAILFIIWPKHRPLGAMLSAGLASSFVIGNLILKNVIQRPRPCWINPEFELLIQSPSDYSMPSGHTLAAFISATIIFRYNKAWGAAAYVLAALMAFSRLYLYVHFPTDILVGMILGIAIGFAVSKIFEAYDIMLLLK